MGEPRTAQRRTSPSERSSAVTAAGVGLAPGLELRRSSRSPPVISELRLASIEVHRDEIEPFALLGVCRRLERGLAGGEIGPGGKPL